MTSIIDGLAPILRDTFAEAEACSYTLKAGGAPVSLKGIFDNRTMIEDGGGLRNDAQSIVPVPTLAVAEADLPPGYSQGDQVVVGAAIYKVRAALPDSHGMVELQLEKAP